MVKWSLQQGTGRVPS